MRSVKLALTLGLTVACSTSNAFAQTEVSNDAPFYETLNTFPTENSEGEPGVRLVFQAHDPLEGGLEGETMERDVGLLCNTWLGPTIRLLESRPDLPKPEFIDLEVRQGGVLGRYVVWRFSIEGKRCR